MDVHLSLEQAIAAVTQIVLTVAAFMKVRSDVRSNAEAQSAQAARLTAVEDALCQRIQTLEDDVEELKKGQVAVALLQQAVESLNATAASMVDESRALRTTVDTMGRALVRVETQLEGRLKTPAS